MNRKADEKLRVSIRQRVEGARRIVSDLVDSVAKVVEHVQRSALRHPRDDNV
jgi:hypothetical protein